VQPENADVTLFYGDRENHFTIPTFLLQQGKMDYAGALFEIVLTQRDGLQSYDFNHLIAEEQAARQAGTPMDLSFLEFLQNGSTAGSRK
jgi:hypothetical protein